MQQTGAAKTKMFVTTFSLEKTLLVLRAKTLAFNPQARAAYILFSKYASDIHNIIKYNHQNSSESNIAPRRISGGHESIPTPMELYPK